MNPGSPAPQADVLILTRLRARNIIGIYALNISGQKLINALLRGAFIFMKKLDYFSVFILGVQISPEDLAEAEDIDFIEEKEDWNIYKLSDGSILKVKLVLTSVKRLKKWNPDGTPVYVINSQNIVRVINVPKELKAKPRGPTFKPT